MDKAVTPIIQPNNNESSEFTNCVDGDTSALAEMKGRERKEEGEEEREEGEGEGEGGKGDESVDIS